MVVASGGYGSILSLGTGIMHPRIEAMVREIRRQRMLEELEKLVFEKEMWQKLIDNLAPDGTDANDAAFLEAQVQSLDASFLVVKTTSIHEFGDQTEDILQAESRGYSRAQIVAF